METRYYKNKRKKIGILGGTFDPVHTGHLVMAEIVRDECGLEKVVFIPAGNPPHKLNRKITLPVHRYKMTEIAVQSNPYFEVNPIEIFREGFTFTVDTLRELRKVYSDENDIYFIIGGDALLEVRSWKDVPEIMKLCHLIVCQRPGYNKAEVIREAETLRVEFGASILLVEGPFFPISSTEIRERIRQGKSFKYLVPEGVEQYILAHSLYKGEYE